MSDTETETLTFKEMLEGTDAERFEADGYDIVGLEWVEGGLRVEAVSPRPAFEVASDKR